MEDKQENLEKKIQKTIKSSGKKLKNILVVEDNPEHLKDARKYFNAIKGVKAYYADSYSEAEEYIAPKFEGEAPASIDGVITDIYFPIGKRYVGNNGDEDPVGVLVAAKCHVKNIPFVFCTGGYHHGVRYNWVNMLQRTMRWPEMIDSHDIPGCVKDANHKPWDKAYKQLKELVEGK